MKIGTVYEYVGRKNILFLIVGNDLINNVYTVYDLNTRRTFDTRGFLHELRSDGTHPIGNHFERWKVIWTPE